MATGFLPKRGSLLGAPKAPSTKPITYPAPTLGMNAVDPLATLDPRYCLLSVNMIPDGRGMRVRSGYELQSAAGGQPIRTVIPFQASVAANDRLFVSTSSGFFSMDPSATSAGTFGITSGLAGTGVWTDFVLDNGLHYAFCADEANGLYRYEEGATNWVTAPSITGVSAANIVFVMQHKGRLWFVERNSARAYYLPAGAVQGAATRFDFGNKFNSGGTLVGLWRWTVDGGDGIDDYLVAIGSGGDVIVYRGSDPSSSATWQAVGQYYIGAPPAGRRIATSFGGELFVLSQYGLLPMSRLVSGRPVQEQDIYASRNIAPLIAEDMQRYRTQQGWEVQAIPTENVLLISTPAQTGLPLKQYALSSKTNGWCVFNDLPYFTGAMWRGEFYFGGQAIIRGAVADPGASTLCKLSGDTDAQGGVTALSGIPIRWSLLPAFTDAGESALYHRIQFLRPVFRSGGPPSYFIQPRYDYNTDDPIGTVVPTPITTASLWDVAIWDSALWSVDAATVDAVTAGSGIGRAMGAALVGESVAETQLLRIDLMFDTGGML